MCQSRVTRAGESRVESTDTFALECVAFVYHINGQATGHLSRTTFTMRHYRPAWENADEAGTVLYYQKQRAKPPFTAVAPTD